MSWASTSGCLFSALRNVSRLLRGGDHRVVAIIEIHVQVAANLVVQQYSVALSLFGMLSSL
eukprot:3196414-Prorocentrum_lima.AAC.1